ncbi:MAG: ribosome-binding factor A [Patescibacteria group bacterium]|nr:ribosome-binding factor A [Patescibacteria group bacterium]MDE1988105.1 ribosome-binding factor A [Patescibacteria group bacterium]MDE2218210.1 ribosome-binding factor A [Patescibacteria group bacterium]
MKKRDEKLKNLIKEAAAKFLNIESNRVSMATVTGAQVSKDGKYATILFTVFPSEKEKAVLDFAKRKRTEFRDFAKKNIRAGRIPFFDFEIDAGEKHRQKIDSILDNN